MGTRALVRVMDGDDEILCLYRHHDGYPDGLGAELKNFCATKVIVDGMRVGMNVERIANGMGCFAAQLVRHMKNGPGSLYVYPIGSRDIGERYEYVVTGSEGAPPTVKTYRVNGYDETRALEAES